MTELVIFGNAQQEFWRREFQAKVIPKTGNYLEEIQNLVDSGIMPIVQIGQNPAEIAELMKFPKKSLVIHLYADETYRVKNNIRVMRLPATYKILRSYPTPRIRIQNIFYSTISSFLDIKNSKFKISNSNFVRFWAAGMVMSLRQVSIRILGILFRKSSIVCPLGYTDIFCISFLNYKDYQLQETSAENESLFLITEKNIQDILQNKKNTICFVGQRGNIAREIAVEEISKTPNSIVIVRDRFGGSIGFNGSTDKTGIEYLKIMLESKFTICPPGNYSGYSFRLMESLLCFTYPIINNYPLTDPLFTNPVHAFENKYFPKTWRKLISNVLTQDFSNVSRNIQIARFDLQKKVDILKFELNNLQRLRN